MKKDPYRYRELIAELNDLVSNGDLLPVDEIQVLRDISAYRDGYHPIIAWYYNREDMADIADEVLESLEDQLFGMPTQKRLQICCSMWLTRPI